MNVTNFVKKISLCSQFLKSKHVKRAFHQGQFFPSIMHIQYKLLVYFGGECDMKVNHFLAGNIVVLFI